MKSLRTIQQAHKMFDTAGSSPLLVTCNDFKDWVCKYDKFPQYLLNELLSSEFGKLCHINIPETAFITVVDEHVPYDKYPTLQPYFFRKECFGSLYIKNTKEIDLSFLPLFKEKSFRDKIQHKSDFLNIALFDIWLANEDRNHNNNNLLLHYAQNNTYTFYAIDHVNIFNSSSLDYGLSQLTEDDTIINTELAKLLFSNNRKLGELMDKLVKNFYLCTEECEAKLDSILALVPYSWAVNTVDIRIKIQQTLFTDEWKKHCVMNFRTFVHSFILS
ncbi:HipA family kinase [Pedobacter psychrodurus]|jgi:hypothetical protein|uniref:HipA family kinase n=1 Tax=Pedobacter psychrodurus TaxID=2530456 RepID=UPI00292F8A10|nr:HipA family kinase [Pedobacter psychrodurus]